MPDPVDIEMLLRHRPFVRALARRLVRDDARAEDVVQDTYVAALKNPPRHAGALRSWLASVVRKIAFTHRRSEARRSARERAAAGPAALPSPEEVVERAGWHQRLVNLVMGLEEPYRTTMLLRYFEDLNSSEIAELHGVPAATVRTRLRRGIEQMRKRLDEDVPGGRKLWLGALLAFAWPDGAPPPPPAVTLRWPVVAAAAAVVAVGLLALQLGGDRDDASDRSRATGRSGARAAPDTEPAEPIDAGTSAAGEALEVTVLADGRPVANADVVLRWLDRRPWREWTHDSWEVLSRGRTDLFGRARFLDVPDGYVEARAAVAGRSQGHAFAHLPQEILHPVVVELPPERIIAVHVMELGSGRRIQGATVEVVDALPEVTVEPTDRTGVARVHGLAECRIRVHAPGYAPYGPRTVSEELLPVVLEPLRSTTTWPIRGAAPVSGTPLVIRRANESKARAEGHVDYGQVIVDGLPRGTLPELLAVAPDGSFARLDAERAVQFEDPVRLALQLRDEAGERVPEVDVAVFGQTARTDRFGRVTLPVYAKERVDVLIRELPSAPFRTVRRFDPSKGSAQIAVTLPNARQVALRVRLDGRPGLPRRYSLYIDKTPVEARADRGTLRFSVRPRASGDSVPLHLLAPGYVAATVDVDTRPRSVEELDIDLIPAGTLDVHVIRRHVSPTRLELVGTQETRRGPWRFELYPGPDRVVRETMLPPGSFRVREGGSDRSTSEFRVLPGRGVAEVWLDLRDLDPPRTGVRGIITAPAFLDLAKARVLVTYPGSGWPAREIEVAGDGAFAFYWHRRAANVAVSHPRATGDGVTLTEARRDVVLHLVPNQRAQLRLTPAPPTPRAGETSPRVRVEPFDGVPHFCNAMLDDGVLRFAGFSPGRCALWIDVAGMKPLRLDEVSLVAGDNDLGRVAASRGSSLRVRIVGRGPLPELILAAQAPRYQRSVHTDGERAVLPGLGEGVFVVTAWMRYTGLKVWSQTITVDGTNDHELEIILPGYGAR